MQKTVQIKGHTKTTESGKVVWVPTHERHIEVDLSEHFGKVFGHAEPKAAAPEPPKAPTKPVAVPDEVDVAAQFASVFGGAHDAPEPPAAPPVVGPKIGDKLAFDDLQPGMEVGDNGGVWVTKIDKHLGKVWLTSSIGGEEHPMGKGTWESLKSPLVAMPGQSNPPPDTAQAPTQAPAVLAKPKPALHELGQIGVGDSEVLGPVKVYKGYATNYVIEKIGPDGEPLPAKLKAALLALHPAGWKKQKGSYLVPFDKGPELAAIIDEHANAAYKKSLPKLQTAAQIKTEFGKLAALDTVKLANGITIQKGAGGYDLRVLTDGLPEEVQGVLKAAGAQESKKGPYLFVSVKKNKPVIAALATISHLSGVEAVVHHVGDTKVENGKTYVLNANHKWELKDKPSAPAPKLPTTFPFKQIGDKAGSNEGGLFEDAFGKKRYIKFPPTEDHAKNEFLANKLYLAAGLDVPAVKLVSKDGKVGIASAYMDGLKNVGEAIKNAPGAKEGFGADAWLANWDSAGLSFDNMLLGPDGKAKRIDPGGSLLFRAQGTPKGADFTTTVPEIFTLVNAAKNPNTTAIFGGMSKQEIDASVAKVLEIQDEDIIKAVAKWGPGSDAEKKALADKLIARKAYLAAQFPGADAIANPPAPDPTKLPVDPTKIPPKVDFANLNGPGKGKSSKAWKNAANQKDFDALYECAMRGDLIALKNYQYMSHADTEQGEETGIKPISAHANKEISTFYSEAVAMMETIAYPSAKKVSNWLTDTAEDVGGLSAAFPGHPFGTTIDKVPHDKRLGFWISLGTVDSAETFIPQNRHNATQELKTQGNKDYNKMSGNLKSWLGNVQGSGSANIGDTAYSTGASQAKLVKEAYEHATEIPEGTVLRRHLNMSSAMIQQMATAPDGHVFENPRSMCCSMNPNWESKGSHFGNVFLEIVHAKGAKGLATFGSGHFMNGSGGTGDEQEITSLPGQRYMIISKGKTSSGHPKYVLLALPPDATYIDDLHAKVA